MGQSCFGLIHRTCDELNSRTALYLARVGFSEPASQDFSEKPSITWMGIAPVVARAGV